MRVMHFYTMNLEKARAPRGRGRAAHAWLRTQATVAVLRNLGLAQEVPAEIADA